MRQSEHIRGMQDNGPWARGLLWPALLGCMAAIPAAAASPLDCPAYSRASTAAWVLADFDGDHKLDLAVADLPGEDGLLRSITIRSGDAGPVPLCATGAAERLRARDLDGDSDRDLVLESAAAEPIAVWLNDGAGHFERGELADFRYQLSHDDPGSLISSPNTSGERDPADHSRTNVSAVRTFDLHLAAAGLAGKSDTLRRSETQFRIYARGPPASF